MDEYKEQSKFSSELNKACKQLGKSNGAKYKKAANRFHVLMKFCKKGTWQKEKIPFSYLKNMNEKTWNDIILEFQK